MQHWLALLGSASAPDGSPGDAAAREASLRALGWWALQFSPRVARLEEAVVLEVAASLRLFGGARRLHRRLWREARDLGLTGMAWAPTSLAALALARAGQHDGLSAPLGELLDAQPLAALSAVQAHEAMLARLGCRRLGQVRALPRAALARRFGDALLGALDRAYGCAPEAHVWLQAPERFEARLELPFRIEHAPALMHYAESLLRQLCGWLAARHAGVKQLTLAWQHDAMRGRDVSLDGALRFGTADATRDLRHLSRLLGEHLARLELAAPVGELSLRADEVMLKAEQAASLLPSAPDEATEPLPRLLERLSVRLGPDRVRSGLLREDHRMEGMQRWMPWPGPARPAQSAATRAPLYPQPSWLLEPPLRLDVIRSQPRYRGAALQLLTRPQRIEGGWWQAEHGDGPGLVQRDYVLALSPQAGLLWIYQQRLSKDESGWFLHGVFA
ncbi:MAG TPA: DNA polymerase Y family protein [Roseateles sp.]|nr:DNA polymerase Y family protein [Roseateles sp.]